MTCSFVLKESCGNIEKFHIVGSKYIECRAIVIAGGYCKALQVGILTKSLENFRF